jgi:hypothetical protein
MRYLFMSAALLAMMAFASHKASPLVVTSTSFANNGSIPLKYSCEGDKVNPPLQITNVPSNAKSLALILHDPDAARPGGFTHWVMWNIDPMGNIPADFKGAVQGLNGTKQPGYIGMCPPTGTHHYHFMVYALDIMLDINKNTDKDGLEKSIQGHIISQGELVGLYKKANQ